MKTVMHTAVVALAMTAMVTAPTPAHAFPGQRLLTSLRVKVAAAQARHRLAKQQDAVIKANPELRALRATKIAEYKAKNTIWEYGAGMVTGFAILKLAHVAISPVTALAQVGAFQGVQAAFRHHEAKVYARSAVLEYAQERGIVVPTDFKLRMRNAE
jgi:hypothetical protein